MLDCTLDLLIVDVASREVAREARAVKMNSQAKESTLRRLAQKARNSFRALNFLDNSQE